MAAAGTSGGGEEGGGGGDSRQSSAAGGGGVGDGLSTPTGGRIGGRRATNPWASATPRLGSPPRFRRKASENPGSGDTALGSGAGASGVSSSLRGGAGSPKAGRRWRLPWGKKSSAVTGSGDDGVGGSRDSLGSASRREIFAAGEGGGQEGDGVSASPTLPPRPPSRGEKKRPGEGRRAPRLRVRWGRVVGTSLALTCAVSAVVALVVTRLLPGDGAEANSPLSVLWKGLGAPLLGLGAYLTGRGEGGPAVWREAGRSAGTKEATAWKAERKRAEVGSGGGHAMGDFDDDA